jgi:hypothetical protein
MERSVSDVRRRVRGATEPQRTMAEAIGVRRAVASLELRHYS